MHYFSARHFGAKHFQSIALRLEIVAFQNPQLPFEPAQIPLAVTLELPLPESLTQIVGIHQSDVIIRSALEVALADIRANPWLLDYVFASLPQDSLTWKQYGEKDVAEAKKWFLSTQVDVSVLPTFNESKWPKITIELMDSSEVQPEASIGDVNYTPIEQNDSSWPALNEQPITPVSYVPSTGIVKLGADPEFFIFPGMFLVDRVGQPHEIIEVIDTKTFKIDPGTVADLSRSNIKSKRPAWNVAVESASFKETYRIGVHVQNEPSSLIWLHSIVVFALQRYKQILMEARGLERTTFGSSQVGRDERFDAENIFSRYISLSGYVRHFWPKAVSRTIDGMEFDGLRVSGQDADVEYAKTGEDPNDSLWVGNLDTLRAK